MTRELNLRSNVAKFAEILTPEQAEEPILAGPVRAAVHEWMTEIWSSAELAKVGIKPRRTGILYGPPGCGKTTLAHHFSARLGVPLVNVKMDALVSSHVGATGNNIASLFEQLKGQETICVLFLDELDAIAAKRTNDNQAAAREMNAIVNSLLMRIEAFQGTAIAATNRSEAIDPALWRRFGLHLDIALPGHDERFAIIKRYLAPFDVGDDDLDVLADETKGASPALIRQLCEGMKRALVLNPRLNRETDLLTILSTITASVKPHEAYDIPPLWEDAKALARASKITWPPKAA